MQLILWFLCLIEFTVYFFMNNLFVFPAYCIIGSIFICYQDGFGFQPAFKSFNSFFSTDFSGRHNCGNSSFTTAHSSNYTYFVAALFMSVTATFARLALQLTQPLTALRQAKI